MVPFPIFIFFVFSVPILLKLLLLPSANCTTLGIVRHCIMAKRAVHYAPPTYNGRINTNPRIRNTMKKMTANSQLRAVIKEKSKTKPKANMTGETIKNACKNAKKEPVVPPTNTG